MINFNTNTDALNALYNLNNISNQIKLSTQRLSSGKRINTPADDPAGFVISNSLQLQLDGINTAIASTQDASSLVKTANGALAQINTLISTIRSAAQTAAANLTTNPTLVAASQQTINQAIASINNIAANTQFGSKSLLNGSAGVSAALTDAVHVAGISIGGTIGGGSTLAGAITVSVLSAATAATITGTVSYASTSALISTGGATTGGDININGQNISIAGTDTVQTALDKINAYNSSTGVNATFTGGKIVLTQGTYGSHFNVSLSSTTAIIGTAGTSTASGVDATATVSAQAVIGGVTTVATATFSGGRASTDSGLRLTDTDGNSILLTGAGNVVASYTAGAASSNASTFQIGPNLGQTASISLPNIYASNLGTTSAPGTTLATIDVTTATGAAVAIAVATEASNQVTQYAAQLGGFQKNVLDASSNVLQVTAANLNASISSITDTNIAEESTNLSNLQTIQQAGIAVLRSAISTPSLYLKLLS